LRIARISHLFYPDIASDYLLELTRKQVEKGNSVDVFTWRKTLVSEKYQDTLRIHRLNGVNFSVKGAVEDYPYLPNLPQELERLKPDVVHAESHLFLPSLQALAKAKSLRIKSVVTIHGVMAKRGPLINLAQYAYLYSLGSTAFRNADVVICLTQDNARQVARLGCRIEKIKVIPNAVDSDRFRPSSEKDLNLISWVGRFVAEKGIVFLLEAARIVVKEHKDARFMLVGTGPLKESLRSLVRKFNLEDYISFPGILCRNEIAKILSRSNIFAFPSTNEGMPIALLEAMAAENAIVAFNIPGINEIVKNNHNGLLVSPSSSKGLAEAIVALIEDSKVARRLGENARDTVKKHYSWDGLIESLNNVYSIKQK
jgi:glycosyltransferase involved in cell wall biosynthesis